MGGGESSKGAAIPHMMQLAGLNILVVEDELLIAVEMEAMLEDLGCHVLGPFSRVMEALDALDALQVDAAVLDVNVRGEMIFPVADRLRARGVPMVFCTGYADLPDILDPLEGSVRLSKPCTGSHVEAALRAELEKTGAR